MGTADDMGDAAESPSRQNYYDGLLDRLVRTGLTLDQATLEVAEAYLDGRPATLGKSKTTRKERDRLFWTSLAVDGCTQATWSSETMVLALARYMGQEPVAKNGLLASVTAVAPESLVRAVRYSGLVLNQHASRCAELREAAAGHDGLMELCKVLDAFGVAHRQRVAVVETLKAVLAELSTFDLLLYVSLYAFEHLVPRDFRGPSDRSRDAKHQTAWDAIGDLVTWKLRTTPEATQALNDEVIGSSIVRHLRPILFEERGLSRSRALQTLSGASQLIDAQIELNEFIGRSADAFSYDDGVRYVRRGDRLEFVEVDVASQSAWRREGRKLECLHGYWLYRAMADFFSSDASRALLGRPENQDANRLAWIHATQGQLRLQEVYGIDEVVTTESGESAPLFQALLALNLMSGHFLHDFLLAFAERSRAAGDWLSGLRNLAIDGIRDGSQIRFPLTWSDRDAKIRNITGWTVTRELPQGSSRVAATVLDFWTYDLVAMAGRLQGQVAALEPHLFERPILKFGSHLVQLPWIVGMQNNSTAAINNLRRLGARRGRAREETQRIESNLSGLLRQRGFAVVTNWQPPPEHREVGEVDVIAVRDECLLVLEVKSTFIRRSQRDAWLHATTTLRKAGRQLLRKVDAVARAIPADGALREALRLDLDEQIARCRGWIVDTSIERDHQHFSGFLKISVEELLIALRDDAHLLADPIGLLSGRILEGEGPEAKAPVVLSTLYPLGFSADRLVEVIETEAVWRASAVAATTA
jgi:Holliday junction resolvase-like predicted endonuclease